MYCLRRTAFRVLLLRPAASSAKPRSFATLTPSRFQKERSSTIAFVQRRWATQDSAQDGSEGTSAVETDHESTTATNESSVAEASSEPESVKSPNQDEQSSIASAISSAGQSVSDLGKSARESVSDAAQGAAARVGLSDESPLYAQQRKADVDPSAQVYVGNLFFDLVEDDLKREFAKYGTIKSVTLLRDDRGLNRGYGYIKFENRDSAEAAVANMDSQILEGRRLTVQFAKTPRRQQENANPNEPTRTLFIGNMAFQMTDADINGLFKDIRNVKDVRVAIDRRTGQPRGFAHADFYEVDSAIEGKQFLEKKSFYGRQLRVDYTLPNKNRVALSNRSDTAE